MKADSLMDLFARGIVDFFHNSNHLALLVLISAFLTILDTAGKIRIQYVSWINHGQW